MRRASLFAVLLITIVISGCGPMPLLAQPSLTPTATATASATVIPTATPTAIPTPTPTATPTPAEGVFLDEGIPEALGAEAQAVATLLETQRIFFIAPMNGLGPVAHKSLSIGAEQIPGLDGLAVDVITVRDRRSGNYVVYVDGWGDNEPRWFITKTVAGAQQRLVANDDSIISPPFRRYLLPVPKETYRSYHVEYVDSDGNVVGRLAPWREWARLIEDPYLWPIAYSVTRMPKDPRFSTIELPKRDTSIVVTPEVRQNWVEGTILRWNGIISEGRPIDRELMQQAADLIVNDLSDEDMQLLLMQPRFVIRFGEIDEIAYYRYRGGYGGDTVGFSNDFIDWRWGSHTPAVLAAALLHEVGVHANQQLSRCTYRSIDGEHAAYYMQLALIWQLDEVYSGYYEDIRFASEGGYPTCWDNANE